MSFWNNMSFGEKLLGLAALGTGVGELVAGGGLFADMGMDTALGGIGGAIDSGASAIGSGISGLLPSSQAAASTAPVTSAGSSLPSWLQTGATPQATTVDLAANPPANAPSGMLSRFTNPANTWSNGYGMGLAGQALVGGTGLGLANAAIQASNKKYGTPGIQPYTGVGSNLTGAQGALSARYMAVGGMTNTPNVPMSHNVTPAYATAQNTPMPQPVMRFDGSMGSQVPNINTNNYDANINPVTGLPYTTPPLNNLEALLRMGQNNQQFSRLAGGGTTNLGHYSDGGQMLKGPGDGMSDSIPATINNKQPARLANDEFVVPADVVSHLGNGSSDAGAKKLYSMMDRVRRARTGSPKQAKAIHPDRYMPG